MATVSGLEFSDDGVLTVTPRPGEGVPDTATVMGGWAADENGAAYIEAASVVPSDAVQIGGLSYTQDGALYVTSAAPSNPVYIGGRAVRQDGALHVKTGTPSGDDQALGGWMTSNAGVAYVDLLPSFWLPLNDLGDGEADITLGMGTGSATFTRATTATTVDSTGMIVSVASGVPRSYYDPTTLEYRGYLAEGARTNLLLWSEGFDNASWSKTDTTITANSIAAPDGATTADLLTEGSAGTAAVSQTVTVTADVNYATSRFIKRGNHDWVLIRIGGGADTVLAWFNLGTGVVGTSAVTGVGVFVSSSIKAYPNGWYRCSLVGARMGGGTASISETRSAASDGSGTRVSGATRYEWGAQFESNVSFASSYIPTTTASVTRNADVLTYTFAGNADATVGTIYAEVSTNWAIDAAVAHAYVSYAAGPTGLCNISNRAATISNGFDGTNVAQKSGLASMNTGTRKRVLAYGGSTQEVTGDGLAPASGTFDGNMGSTAIGICCTPAGANQLDGTIKNARIYTTQFSAAQLQAATA